MPTLPVELSPLIVEFAPLFSKPVWKHAKVLLVGAILAIGKRTVTSCLRVTGKSHEKLFQNYHRVLNRARWSALDGSRILLRILVRTFAPGGELVIGIDDTIERRRGTKIKAKGIYRDPVRSSQSHFVKGERTPVVVLDAPGGDSLGEMCLGLAVSDSALPVGALLHWSKKRRHQRLTDRAWQVIQLIVRWLPDRDLVFLGDGSFAVLDLLFLVSTTPRADLITRLRLDAQLYHLAPEAQTRTDGRPRVKGARRPSPQQILNDRRTRWTKLEVENWYGETKREIEIYTETAIWYCTRYLPVPIRWVLIRDPLGKFEPQALVSTNLDHTAMQILTWFVRRWRMEVTFEEARAHVGIESQRQWSDPAIARTTPVLFGLYSMVTLIADQLIKNENYARPNGRLV